MAKDGWGGGKLRQDDKSVIMSVFVERAQGCERDNEKVVKERRSRQRCTAAGNERRLCLRTPHHLW